MRIFLDSNYDKILNVASIINNSKAMTIKEISEKVSLSIPSVRNIVDCIEKNNLTTKENFFIEELPNKSVEIRAINYPLQQLADNYLEQSILFLMVKQHLENRKIVSSKFCESYGISASSFSRYRMSLKKYLQSIGLDLSRENEIIGNEMLVRSFFIAFFRYSNSKWKFSPSVYISLKEFLSKNYMDLEQFTENELRVMCLIMYIGNKRIAQKNFLSDIFFAKLGNIFIRNTVIAKKFFDYFKKKGLDNEQIEFEVGYLLFSLKKEGLLCDNQVLQLMEKFLLSCTEEYKIGYQLSLAVTSNSDNSAICKEILIELIFMNLIIKKGYIPYRHFYYVYDEENFCCFNNAEKKLLEDTYDILSVAMECQEVFLYYKEFIELYNFKELADYFFTVLYAILIKSKLSKPRPITIFIEHSKFMNCLILSNKLKSIFHESIEIIENCNNKVDIVVTDISNSKKGGNVIRVSSYSDEKDFELLLLKILDIRKKIDEGDTIKHLLPYLSRK